MKSTNSIIDIDESFQIFRDYLDTVYAERKIHTIIPLSTGYQIGSVLSLPKDMLMQLLPMKNGKEIERGGYGWNFDSTGLKDAIASYENTKIGSETYSIQNICLTLGGTYGLNRLIHLLSSPEDEMLIVGPTFVRLFGQVKKKLEIKMIIGNADKGFVLSSKEILEHVTSNTKFIFICNPSNPLYTFMPALIIDHLINEVKKRKIYLILDEVGDAYRTQKFQNYSYSNHIKSDYVIRICSASKSFLLAEYRLGYTLSNSDIATKLSREISDDVSHINIGATEAWKYGLEQEQLRLKHQDDTMKKVNTQFIRTYKTNQKKLLECRNIAISALKRCKKVTKIIYPDACFSFLFKVETNRFQDDIALFKSLLLETGISLVPGSGFGLKKSDLFLRLTYAYPKRELKKTILKITKFLEILC